MAIRLSGLASGMDTESMVTELMKAQRLKSTSIENKITKLQWKQDKWKELNTKLYAFYTGPLSKMRLQGGFSTKKTSSSDESKVSLTAGSNAPEGSHSIEVKQLAKSQFVTGDIKGIDKNGKEITTSTKLTDLNFSASEGSTITVKAGEKQVSLDIGSSTTIGDFVNTLKNAGLSASYDATQDRFFIGSKESGVNNAFSITMTASEAAQDRNDIRDFINYGSLSSTDKAKVDNALTAYVAATSTAEDIAAARTNLLNAKYTQVRNDYIKSYITNQGNIDAARAELSADGTLTEEELKKAVETKLKADAQAAVTTEYDAWKAGGAPNSNVFAAAETDLDAKLATYSTDSGTSVTQTNSLSLLGLSEITTTNNGDGTVTVNYGGGVTVVNPSDSKVVYNGATLTSSSNTINANGLTFTVKGLTAAGEVVNLSVSNDTQAVYDMVKDFIKSYNELITELNKNYNATSSKGYEPLTDDQRESMTDSQIEKWEAKIKDSLLRRDQSVDSLVTAMRTKLNETVAIDGKKYTLSSFGIKSANYFEKGLLHIDGDEDDSLVSTSVNKLMDTLTKDPDTVMNVINQLASNLYSVMTDKMKSTTLSSALTFYNDKEITKSITNYQSDLKVMEKKLTAIENRYYKQFSAMESAMAKMNSQSSSLASMLGMGK
jgi:flagellar hook-associated protein 2